jgi:hypothetical protein
MKRQLIFERRISRCRVSVQYTVSLTLHEMQMKSKQTSEQTVLS